MKRYAVITSIILVLFGVVFVWWVVQWDLMDTIFQPSKNLDQVINIGNSSRAVGNTIFRGWLTVGLGGTSQKAPLLVSIAQTLLRLVIVLAIPILIYIGVKIIYGSTQWKSIQEGIKEVGGVLLWLVIALSAVGIIYIIQSLAARSLVVL